MSTAPDKRFYSLAEYLVFEERSLVKHDYYRGELFAMAGASPRHNRIAGNIFGNLFGLLKGKPCEPFGSDQRVRVKAVNFSAYPDISVVCGKLEMADDDRQAITNPRIIIEVLSPATDNYDRGPKFELYQNLASLQEYVLVSQDEAKVTQYIRNDDGSWRYRLLAGLDQALELTSIGCKLPFDEIYRNVEFGPENAGTEQAN